MSSQYSWDTWESKSNKTGTEKRGSRTAIFSRMQETELDEAEKWATPNYINLKPE